MQESLRAPAAPSRNMRLLFATRILRLFAYGFLSVLLVLHLSAAGLSESQIGLLLTLTLLGDTVISLWTTTNADRIGRKRMLIAGALLMVFAGVIFASTRSFVLLLLAATIGVISPSGNEVGPFLAIEQASLAEEATAERRTGLFAWYNLVGSFATALGALAGGALAQTLQSRGMTPLTSYRAVVLIYALVGIVMMVLFMQLSSEIEPPPATPIGAKPTHRHGHVAHGRDLDRNCSLDRHHHRHRSLDLGLGQSRGIVLRLASLFSLDAFAGGFVVQAFVAYWFHTKFGVALATLGGIFFGANVLAGISALSATHLARRIGLLRTMVLTHIPSNLLLALVPLMPNLTLAIAVLFARFSISQMDVPTRQAYTLALVAPTERSAAAGVTGIARTVGASLSPLAAGPLYAVAGLASWPFFIAGGLKIAYDILIWRSFRKVKLPSA